MTKPRTKVHPLIATQVANAALLTIQIEAAAKRLARLMDELHGEEFKFCVEHKAGAEFILISSDIPGGSSSRG